MKHLKQISLQTVPNGYAFSYDGHEFLYFNEVDLLAGMMVRIGSGETKEMEKGTILNSLFDVMLGEKYAKDVSRLNDTVNRLAETYSSRIAKLTEQINILNDAIAKHETLKKQVETTTELTNKMAEGYKQAYQPYDEYNRRISRLEANTMKMESKFSTVTDKAELKLHLIERVLERSEEQEKLLSAKVRMLFGKIEQTKGKEQPVTETHEEAPDDDDDGGSAAVDDEPKKRKKTDKAENKAKSTKTGKTGKGGRSKGDAAVLAEMEKQLQEHWDKKGWE